VNAEAEAEQERLACIDERLAKSLNHSPGRWLGSWVHGETVSRPERAVANPAIGGISGSTDGETR
jgi:hypothetical protein